MLDCQSLLHYEAVRVVQNYWHTHERYTCDLLPNGSRVKRIQPLA